MAQSEATKDTKPEPSEAEEFLIAADLTLYANPLRSLTIKPKKTGQTQSTPSAPKQEIKDEEREMIAADLTKYGSPLDDKN